jgi:hypothetical protein
MATSSMTNATTTTQWMAVEAFAIRSISIRMGGALYISEGTTEIVDTVLYANLGAEQADVAYIGDAANLAITSSNIWPYTSGAFSTTGTLLVSSSRAVPPEFLDETAGDPQWWDLHLLAGSPLIDAGFHTNADPDGSRSDIGAYGNAGASSWDLDWDGYPDWWLPGSYDPATSPGADCDDDDEMTYPGSGC